MAGQAAKKLERKQILLSRSNVQKLDRLLATKRYRSAAEIVRLAIDAYDPEAVGEMDADELAGLVGARLKEAITSTRAARRKVESTLKVLERRG